MTNLAQSSPFDSIRHEDEQSEYWLARELMPLLGYTRWNEFKAAIDRAMIACENRGNDASTHFSGSILKTQGRPKEDFKLSRLGCYLVAMNGDPRKPEIAAAQNYFVVKTREAEVVIPQQDAELERLKIQLAIAQANAELVKNERLLFEQRARIYEFNGEAGLLVIDGKEPVIVEQHTLEVIDDKHKTYFKGQTLKQVAEYVRKRYGVRVKDGGVVKKLLKAAEKDSLITSVPRAVIGEYIPQEHLNEVYKILTEGNRQMLLGE